MNQKPRGGLHSQNGGVGRGFHLFLGPFFLEWPHPRALPEDAKSAIGPKCMQYKSIAAFLLPLSTPLLD
jgi:hypothetical protein